MRSKVQITQVLRGHCGDAIYLDVVAVPRSLALHSERKTNREYLRIDTYRCLEPAA